MKPCRTPSSTEVFRHDLWVQRDRHHDGSPIIRSTWELSAEEREAIAEGANVELIVWGYGTPPVALHTTTEPLGRAA